MTPRPGPTPTSATSASRCSPTAGTCCAGRPSSSASPTAVGAWSTARPTTAATAPSRLLHDPARDTILLVRQYRLPAHLNGHPDGMLLEAPAGLLDDGEEAVRRCDGSWTRRSGTEVESTCSDLSALYMSPGSVTEHLTFFAGAYSPATSAGVGGGRRRRARAPRPRRGHRRRGPRRCRRRPHRRRQDGAAHPPPAEFAVTTDGVLPVPPPGSCTGRCPYGRPPVQLRRCRGGR